MHKSFYDLDVHSESILQITRTAALKTGFRRITKNNVLACLIFYEIENNPSSAVLRSFREAPIDPEEYAEELSNRFQPIFYDREVEFSASLIHGLARADDIKNSAGREVIDVPFLFTGLVTSSRYMPASRALETRLRYTEKWGNYQGPLGYFCKSIIDLEVSD